MFLGFYKHRMSSTQVSKFVTAQIVNLHGRRWDGVAGVRKSSNSTISVLGLLYPSKMIALVVGFRHSSQNQLTVAQRTHGLSPTNQFRFNSLR